MCTHIYSIISNIFIKCAAQNLKINLTQNPPLHLVVRKKVTGEDIWLPLIAATD